MRSEDSRVQLALEALALPIAAFRAAIGAALLQGETVLAEATADAESRTARTRAELGEFAAGHLDPQAFASRFARVAPAAGAAREALLRGISILRDLWERGDALFTLSNPAGSDLAGTIATALEQVGEAFGAVELIEQVRRGQYRAEEQGAVLADTAFAHWSRTARRLAPPLVVSVRGEDLHAAGLAEFCDGNAKLVLVVDGPCAPAPLVRLITPGTFVVQTTDRAGLDRFVACEGPAVAALVPEGAARFLHDPAGGKESWQRLSVLELPAAPRRGLAGLSAWQQAEDLEQLATLARAPFNLPTAGLPATAPLGEQDAVDRLAAWLLTQHNPLDA